MVRGELFPSLPALCYAKTTFILVHLFVLFMILHVGHLTGTDLLLEDQAQGALPRTGNLTDSTTRKVMRMLQDMPLARRFLQSGNVSGMDPLMYQQWYLPKINATGAWATTTGAL